MEKRISKIMAVMFAMALAFAYSCGSDSDGGGSSNGGSSTPNEPTETGTSNLTSSQRLDVESAVQGQVQSITSIISGLGMMTSKSPAHVATTIPESCYESPSEDCSLNLCFKGTADASGGSVKYYVKDLPMECGEATITEYEWTIDYDISGDEVTASMSGGIEVTGETEGYFTYSINKFKITFNIETETYSDLVFDYDLPDFLGTGEDIRIYFKADSSGNIDGWVAENDVEVATISGNVNDVLITWIQ